MMCMSCEFILIKSLNLLLYFFFPVYICIVIDSLPKNGSLKASGYCQILDLDHFLGPRFRVAQVHVEVVFDKPFVCVLFVFVL